MLLPDGISVAERQEDVRFGSKYDSLFRIWEEMPPNKWLVTWNWRSNSHAEYLKVSLRKRYPGQVQASRAPKNWFGIGPALALGRPESPTEVKLLEFGELENSSQVVYIEGKVEINYLVLGNLPWRAYSYNRYDTPNAWIRLRKFNFEAAELNTWYKADLKIFFQYENGVWEDDQKWRKSIERFRAFTKVGYGTEDKRTIKTRFSRGDRAMRYMIKER